MSNKRGFKAAFAYQDDVLALPVTDLDGTSEWYSRHCAAILVSNIQGIKDELESNGVSIGNWRVDERDGQKLQVFFVVAPDGLCYYFHEPIQGG